METNKIKRGMIVTVKDGVAFGNPPNSVTKVLSKVNQCNDSMFKITNSRKLDRNGHPPMVLCEDIISKSRALKSNFYLNKPAYYEFVVDLCPATKEEKKFYHHYKKLKK